MHVKVWFFGERDPVVLFQGSLEEIEAWLKNNIPIPNVEKLKIE